ALRNPTTGIAGCSARAASGHAAAPPSQRDELAPFHCPMSPVLPTGRIAHLGSADCCIHPPGRNETIGVTPPIIFPKEVAQNRPPHFLARSRHRKSFQTKFPGMAPG